MTLDIVELCREQPDAALTLAAMRQRLLGIAEGVPHPVWWVESRAPGTDREAEAVARLTYPLELLLRDGGGQWVVREGPERFRDGITVAKPARVGQLSFSVSRRTNSAASASVISMCSVSL